MTKFIAKHFYEISDTEIIIENNKPYFKSKEIFFSISHSNDIVLVAFNNKNIGVDVEFLCERKNYKAIMERYGKIVHNPSRVDFYKFWTIHEAEIKLNSEIKSLFSSRLGKDYIVSCVSDDVFVTSCFIKQLSCNGDNIDLIQEFSNPEKCYLISNIE